MFSLSRKLYQLKGEIQLNQTKVVSHTHKKKSVDVEMCYRCSKIDNTLALFNGRFHPINDYGKC